MLCCAVRAAWFVIGPLVVILTSFSRGRYMCACSNLAGLMDLGDVVKDLGCEDQRSVAPPFVCRVI